MGGVKLNDPPIAEHRRRVTTLAFHTRATPSILHSCIKIIPFAISLFINNVDYFTIPGIGLGEQAELPPMGGWVERGTG